MQDHTWDQLFLKTVKFTGPLLLTQNCQKHLAASKDPQTCSDMKCLTITPFLLIPLTFPVLIMP